MKCSYRLLPQLGEVWVCTNNNSKWVITGILMSLNCFTVHNSDLFWCYQGFTMQRAWNREISNIQIRTLGVFKKAPFYHQNIWRLFKCVISRLKNVLRSLKKKS